MTCSTEQRLGLVWLTKKGSWLWLRLTKTLNWLLSLCYCRSCLCWLLLAENRLTCLLWCWENRSCLRLEKGLCWLVEQWDLNRWLDLLHLLRLLKNLFWELLWKRTCVHIQYRCFNCRIRLHCRNIHQKRVLTNLLR